MAVYKNITLIYTVSIHDNVTDEYFRFKTYQISSSLNLKTAAKAKRVDNAGDVGALFGEIKTLKQLSIVIPDGNEAIIHELQEKRNNNISLKIVLTRGYTTAVTGPIPPPPALVCYQQNLWMDIDNAKLIDYHSINVSSGKHLWIARFKVRGLADMASLPEEECKDYKEL